MGENVFMFDGEDSRMRRAYEAARDSFRFFWRELSWERRRIIPGLDMAMIKLPFTDGARSDGNPEFEHMWAGEVDFDGQFVSGCLINTPNWLKSVKEGDQVRAPFSHLTDWMMTVDGVAYGGYTVNLIRSGMEPAERKAHDDQWGLDFGDPTEVRVEIVRGHGAKGEPPSDQKEIRDHPMCVNMLKKIEAQLKEDSSIARSKDQRGWTLLHSEALAGNFGVVRLLVQYGADVNAKTPDGRDAVTLARSIGWNHIASYLFDAQRH